MKPTRRSVLATLAKSAGAAVVAPHLAFARTQAASSAAAPLVDPLRPAFHYLPARNWMNDPCAPVFFRGQYHLFHQYNPHASVWGDMHWAHATSPDMIHWQRLPIAIAPTPNGPDSAGVFTGSAFFHHDTPAVIYTGVQSVPHEQATISDGTHNFRETQLLATSTDPSLGTWTKRKEPVIPTPPPGMTVTGFRDPTPFEHAGTQYLIVGSGQLKIGGMVLLYRASRKLPNGDPDLTQWEYLHPLAQDPNFTPPPVPKPDTVDTGEMWECPDFFSLGGRQVLIYSTRRITFWQVGDLDPATLRFHPTSSGQLDGGHSFYAPKSQLDADGNRILWGWLNETRPEPEFAAAGWAGMLALPRVLTVEDGELRMRPLPGLSQLRTPTSAGTDVHEFTATLQQQSSGGAPAPSYTLTDATGPLLTIRSLGGKPAADNELVIPAGVHLPESAPVHAFFDNSVLELFVGDRLCYTQRFYHRDPAKPVVTLALVGNHKVVDPRSFSLQSIWPD